jgi:hypothetical protein
MHVPVFQADGAFVVEVETRVSLCVILGCDGHIVRHSLGAGQSVLRCTRCFRRYQVRTDEAKLADGRLQRPLNEFASWRDA